MQFQVPQFIEVEDKIFGPLTFRQFIYLAGGAGVIAILYTLLPFFFVVLFGIPVIAFALALAFYRVNDRPFIEVVEAAFGYLTGTKLYLWQKRTPEPTAKNIEAQVTQKAAVSIPKLSESKLKDLAWSLDVQERNRQ